MVLSGTTKDGTILVIFFFAICTFSNFSNTFKRSKKDITVLREESKNRQKLLRAQMKDLFRELAGVLRPPLDSNQEKTKVIYRKFCCNHPQAILQRAIEYIRYCNQIIDQQGSQRVYTTKSSLKQLGSFSKPFSFTLSPSIRSRFIALRWFFSIHSSSS